MARVREQELRARGGAVVGSLLSWLYLYLRCGFYCLNIKPLSGACGHGVGVGRSRACRAGGRTTNWSVRWMCHGV